MFRANDATVTLLRTRWKTGRHVGGAMPFAKAWVRTGRLHRAFEEVSPSQVYSRIPGLGHGVRKVWQGRWDPANSWRELPTLKEVELNTDFSQNGVTQATITLDTLGMTERSGVAGIYHVIERGYYAPLRGYKPPGRPRVGTRNEWFDVLHDKSTQIMIVAGYGEDAAIPVFCGLLNDVSLTSLPDQATVTARDFGQLLTDQPVFANAKVQKVNDPITFADSRRTDRVTPVQGPVDASGHDNGHPASFAVDGNRNTAWHSEALTNRNDRCWIEMKLPKGRYGSFTLAPGHPGLECYVALHRNGSWQDAGRGDVPGLSIPFIRHIKRVKGKKTTYKLPNDYVCQDGDRLRLYFTNLAEAYSSRDRRVYRRASVQEFEALHRKLPKEAKDEDWILVDDAADVVRTVLQWCGLDREWEIENTGVHLSDKIVFNRSDKLIDIVNKIAEMTNYVFYIRPPSKFDDDDLTKDNSNNLSLGVPVFRQNQAMRPPRSLLERMESVTEDDLLTQLEPTFSDEPLSYNIRVRGKHLSRRKGGRVLGADRTPRAMYVYRPPWSRDSYPGGNWPDNAASNQYRNGNIKKYVVHHDPMLRNEEECEVAALFIAFREALESAKATCEFPAMPTIFLDHQVAVRDTGTGLSARLWVTNRTMNIRLGEDAQFKMGIGGSILDTPDINRVRDELVESLRRKGYDPGLSWWEQTHRPEYKELSNG